MRLRLLLAHELQELRLPVRHPLGVHFIQESLGPGKNNHDLIDHMHVAIVPIVLGRGERVWDGLEGLEQRFNVESVSSPSGVTHLTFAR